MKSLDPESRWGVGGGREGLADPQEASHQVLHLVVQGANKEKQMNQQLQGDPLEEMKERLWGSVRRRRQWMRCSRLREGGFLPE